MLARRRTPAADAKGRPELVAKCPWRIGIVSTGLIVKGDDEGERGALAKKSFGVVILDEAHKARASRGMQGRDPPKPNNLLDFPSRGSPQRPERDPRHRDPDPTRCSGTVGPAFRTQSRRTAGSRHTIEGGEWTREESIQFLTGNELGRRTTPIAGVCSAIRCRLRASMLCFATFATMPAWRRRRFSVRALTTQSPMCGATFSRTFDALRNVTTRSCGAWCGEPARCSRNGDCSSASASSPTPVPTTACRQSLFNGEGLIMSLAFNAAYEAAEAFSRLYAARRPGAGFLKTILLRRIGSSARAGLETARHLLRPHRYSSRPEDEVGDEGLPTDDAPPDPQEIALLREVERNLAAVVGGTATDPKVQVILHYLRERHWLERNGAIIFSQYRTTAEWVLEALCAAFPDEPVALYAGGAASFVQRGTDRRSATREHIKTSIQEATFAWSARPMPHARALIFNGSAPKSMSTCPGTLAARTAQRTSTKDRPGSRRCPHSEPAIRGNGRGPSLRHPVTSLWRYFLRARPAPGRI